MISYCTALSNAEAGDMLRAKQYKGRPLVEGFGYVAWIGIEPVESPLRRFPQDEQLLLRFDDVTDPADDAAAARWFSTREQPSLVQPTDAALVRIFTQRLHDDHRPWALLVHCTAGISRSTAVALWVREHYGVTLPELRWTHWRPNATVARLLRS